jgi:acylphosphatase
VVVSCRRFVVRGRVQGVFYRASTQQAAQRLGLTGWVRNRADGCVELVASGEDARLDELEKWLWQGPPNARVENVTAEPAPPQAFQDFRIAR